LQEEVAHRRSVSNAVEVATVLRMEGGATEVLVFLLEVPDLEVGDRLLRHLQFSWM
jgi:hypothetical protein